MLVRCRCAVIVKTNSANLMQSFMLVNGIINNCLLNTQNSSFTIMSVKSPIYFIARVVGGKPGGLLADCITATPSTWPFTTLPFGRYRYCRRKIIHKYINYNSDIARTFHCIQDVKIGMNPRSGFLYFFYIWMY